MTLFIAELRKIWRPIPILILVAMGALWAFVGIMPAYQAFHETETAVGWLPFDLTSQERLVQRYGPLASESTINKMKADIPRLETQATKDIQAHPDAARTMGISDFAGYERWYNAVADRTFFPTGAPNALDPNHTASGELTAAGKAAREAKRANDPTVGLSDEQQRALDAARSEIENGSEALQDLYNISMLLDRFPMTPADAHQNLTNSVEMWRSTATTDHPVTPLQQQIEREKQQALDDGTADDVIGGCVSMVMPGETVTATAPDANANGDAGANAETGEGKSTESSGDTGTATGRDTAPDGAETGDGTANGDAQLGEGCDPADAMLGGQSYNVPGTMPAAVTDRLARYNADPDQSGYLDYALFEHTWLYVAAMATFAVVASAALTVPAMVRDRGRRMTQLQWASRSGRGGQWTRLAALTTSSLAVALLTLAAFGTPLVWMLRAFLGAPVLTLQTNTGVAGISLEYRFTVPIVPWERWNVGQWLALMGAAIVALTLAVTLLGAWLCRSLGSMIRMLLVMVPLVALVLMPAQIVYFPHMFLMGNWLTNRLTVPGLEGWLPLGAALLAAGAWAFSTWRLRHRELLV